MATLTDKFHSIDFWIYSWSLRFHLSANCLLQILQVGFSLVTFLDFEWINKCMFKFLLLFNCFWQISQIKILSDFPLFCSNSERRHNFGILALFLCRLYCTQYEQPGKCVQFEHLVSTMTDLFHHSQVIIPGHLPLFPGQLHSFSGHLLSLPVIFYHSQ